MTTESEPETRDVLRRPVSRPVVFGLVIALPLLGFLIGSLGTLGGSDSTTSVKATVTPKDIGLKAGQSGSVTVLINNPTDEGVRVTSIAASKSDAAQGCPAGALASEELSNPAGYIPPNDVNAYAVTVTLQDGAADGCLNQALTLPLTAELTASR